MTICLDVGSNPSTSTENIKSPQISTLRPKRLTIYKVNPAFKEFNKKTGIKE